MIRNVGVAQQSLIAICPQVLALERFTNHSITTARRREQLVRSTAETLPQDAVVFVVLLGHLCPQQSVLLKVQHPIIKVSPSCVYYSTTMLSLVGAATSIIFVEIKQVFCHDNRDKTFVMTKLCLSQQIFVQHNFVETNIILS